MPEDDYLLAETCGLHFTLCNKNSCADVQISITIISNTVLNQAISDRYYQITQQVGIS